MMTTTEYPAAFREEAAFLTAKLEALPVAVLPLAEVVAAARCFAQRASAAGATSAKLLA
jgi:hypothetical protein